MVDGTNKKLVRDIAAALAAERGDEKKIDKAISRSRGAIPATLGTGFEGATAAGGGGTGTGIVGDLVEPNAGTRTFHAVPRQISSTDGVFMIEIRDLKTIDLEDESGNITTFGFDQPS